MPLLLRSEEHTSELQSPCNLVCLLCLDRKSTRLNSSHLVISYAVFCLKKKKPPTIPWHATLIYELHVKGFTMRHPDVPALLRGTYEGLATVLFFFFNDTATTEIYTLSLHDALPI